MKRSEMIKELMIIIHCSKVYDLNTRALHLLSFLESKGMLPPRYYKDVNDFAMSYCDNPADLIEVYATNEWEPEDEI